MSNTKPIGVAYTDQDITAGALAEAIAINFALIHNQ